MCRSGSPTGAAGSKARKAGDRRNAHAHGADAEGRAADDLSAADSARAPGPHRPLHEGTDRPPGASRQSGAGGLDSRRRSFWGVGEVELRQEPPDEGRAGRSRPAGAAWSKTPTASCGRSTSATPATASRCRTTRSAATGPASRPRRSKRQHPGAVALVSIGCGADQNPTSGVTGDKVEVARGAGPRDRRRSRAARSDGRSRRSAASATSRSKSDRTAARRPADRRRSGRRRPSDGTPSATTPASSSRSSTAARSCQTKIDYPVPDLGVRRPAGDGLPRRRGRRRLRAAAQEGTRPQRGSGSTAYANDVPVLHPLASAS